MFETEKKVVAKCVTVLIAKGVLIFRVKSEQEHVHERCN